MAASSLEGLEDKRILSSPEGQWIGVAANASSGRGAGRRAVARLAGELDRLGIGCRVAWTHHEHEQLVEEAGRDPACRCLVAAGGDGTVSALINRRPLVPIAVLPTGTENLFARHFRVGRRPDRLASSIFRGRVKSLDLGVAGDRLFSLMVGVGFDAAVVTRHHEARLGLSGSVRPTHRAAYVEPVLRTSLTYRFPRLSVRIDDPGAEETLVGTTAFIFNLPSYALGLPFAPGARGDDGSLDLVVFREPGALRALHYLWLVLRGRHLRRDDVQHRRVRSATIASEADVPIQLDGDPGGRLGGLGDGGLSVEVLPGAVEVVLS